MRFGVIAMALVACSVQPVSQPVPPVTHQAADLRVKLSLLFSENVLLIAKQSEAAANHSDEYPGYVALMATNADDLRSVVDLAFGDTGANDFFALWTAHDVNVVEYTIGVVTHNQERANQALVRFGESGTALADFFTSQLHLQSGTLAEQFNAELTPIELFVNDELNQNYQPMFPEIDAGYTAGSAIGDVLGPLIAAQFPDKFPGDATSHAVTLRVTVNDRLLERAYLISMATDAEINARDAERQQAEAQLAGNAGAIGVFKDAWARQVTAAEAYASDPSAKGLLTRDFVTALATAAAVPSNVIGDQASAMARVIEDQRTKSFNALAGDDRASATAMQPVADVIAPSVKG